MEAGLRRIFATLAVFVLLTSNLNAAPTVQAHPSPKNYVTHDSGKLAGIAIGLVAVGVGIGVAVYYGVHHSHSLKGCTASGPEGMLLTSDGDRQTWSLAGNVSSVQAGELVRVSGSKQKKAAGGARQFVVEKVAKDFGPYKVSPSGQR